jgi:hypothetical protein
VAVKDARPFGVKLERGVGGKPSLADPRLAGDQDRLAKPTARRLPQGRKALALGCAPDVAPGGNAAKPGRQRQAPDRVGEWLPVDLEGLDRLGKPLQLERADGIERVLAPPGGHHPRQLADQDLIALRARAEPRRLDHRRPEPIALGALGLPVCDPDPDRELLVGFAVSPLDALLDSHRAGDRARGARKRDHQAVAEGLYLLALGL